MLDDWNLFNALKVTGNLDSDKGFLGYIDKSVNFKNELYKNFDKTNRKYM